jgi:hypothetical protein
MFAPGDYVRKNDDAKFEGVVVAAFETRRGKVRVVVEAVTPEFEGLLHIYDPLQLVLVKAAT